MKFTTTHTVAPLKAPYTEAQQPVDEHFDALLTASEVAQLLKVPVSWVYERTRGRGFDRLPHFKLGKYLRFSKKEILDWLDKERAN